MCYCLFESERDKMAFVVRFRDTPGAIKEKMAKIRNMCTCQSSQPHVYVYDPNKDGLKIKSEKSIDDFSRIFVTISETREEILVVLPYHVYHVMMEERALNKPMPMILPVPDFEKVEFVGTLREKQKIDSKKILSMLGERGYCYFMAHPGYGKTIIIAFIIAYLKQKSIVIVPSTSLSTQTVDTLRKRLPDLKVMEVGVDKKFPEEADVVVCFIGRLRVTPDIIKLYRTVVFDEVHLLTSPQSIPALLSVRPRHLLAVTATEGDRKEMTELFVGKCEIQSLSDKKWSIAFPKVRSNLKGDYSSVEGYTAAMGDLSKSTTFTNTIAKMTRYFHGLDKRVIIITMRREMSTALADLLKGLKVSILSPETPTCENSDVIIGTHKYVGTGFDLANYIKDFDGKCASVAIFLGSIKNETLMYQTSGRSFRSEHPVAIYPHIIDLPVSESHTKQLKLSARNREGCTELQQFASFLEQFND